MSRVSLAGFCAARRAALLVGLTMAAGCGSGRPAASVAPRSPSDTVTLALEPYFRELRTVLVSAGGESLRLLLDTGGGATLVTPEVATRRGCQPYGRDVGHRMTGERVEFQQCEALDLSVGAWQARFEPVAVFDVNGLLPPELPRLDGVLALDAFRGQVISLDWRSGRVAVHSVADAEGALRQHGLPVRLATGVTGRMFSPFVPVAASRGPLWFLLDSGNIRGILLARHVVSEGRLKLAPDRTVTLRIGTRPGVTLPAEADDLVIDGSVGASYLMQGPVTLDLRGAGLAMVDPSLTTPGARESR
ncbi:MAG TPA: hypothetical protein VJ648_04290 [Vicinamibacteria bacterium]|nr:hypothetical protein [Vicinamibacteria bacterium]